MDNADYKPYCLKGYVIQKKTEFQFWWSIDL
jgi:hypothetical protein